jgi:copper chaperone CopZ
MKKILILLNLIFCISVNAQIVKAEIIATGLTCSMCSKSIHKQLTKLPEIEKIEVDLNNNSFIVLLKKGNKITPRILKESIEKAGFFVGEMFVWFENEAVSSNYIFLNDDKTFKYKILDKGYTSSKEYRKNKKIYSKILTYLIENEDNYHLIAAK